MITRLITAVCIVVFFATVRPSEVPPMWIVAALAIGSYEAMARSTAGAKRAQKRRNSRRRKAA